MLFMIVERFRHGAKPVYRRAADQGRLLPSGLEYVNSWVDQRLDRCFQLMRTHDPRLLDEWTQRWDDLVEFEVVQVIESAAAAQRIIGTLVDSD